jgi:Arc/MetJ family transcription regulator
MVNRDLLKEAIADAKAVKETAIANAKAALEEAFTPYLKEKLAAKLAEMDEEDEGKETMEEADLTHDTYGKIDLTVDDYSDDYPKKKTAIAKYGDDETEKMGGGTVSEEEEMDEMDLDELLRELDDMEENINGTDVKDTDKELGDHGNIINIDEAEEEGEYEDEDADGVEDSEDEEIDIESMDESDLKSFIEMVIADMVAAGELEGGHEGMEGEEHAEPDADNMGGPSDHDADNAYMEGKGINERKKYGGNKGDVPASKRGDKKDTADEEGVEDYKKKLKEMKEELDEAYNALSTIKTELQEVNLFNAKLLYTNKIFKAKNLTESQKVKVLAAFDKAASVKEAKLVFETLSEGMKETKKTVNESMLRGSASRAAGVAEKKPILEVNDQFARWQTLAGIKK